MKNYIVILIAFASLNGMSQKWSTNLTPEELATEKKVLAEKHPGIFSVEKIIDIHKIKSDLSRVDYTFDGAYFEAFINSGTKSMLLIETDQLIEKEVAPAIVKAHALSGNYANWNIDKIFKVSTPTTANLYRVDVYKDDKNKMEYLYFDDKGEFSRAPAK